MRTALWRSRFVGEGKRAHINLACGHSLAEAALRAAPLPDVLFCYSDYDAVFVQQVLNRMGLRVPEDIGIITFEGDCLPYSLVELTYVSIPWYGMGEAAARMALSLGAEEADRSAPVKFVGEIVAVEVEAGAAIPGNVPGEVLHD